MHTNANSILESIYAASISETNTVNSITVPVTAGFLYTVEIMKVGRRVTLNLNVVNDSGGFLSGTPFKITNITGNQYLATPSQLINYQLFDNNGTPAQVTISASPTETSIVIATIPTTSFKGVITYNTLN